MGNEDGHYVGDPLANRNASDFSGDMEAKLTHILYSGFEFTSVLNWLYIKDAGPPKDDAFYLCLGANGHVFEGWYDQGLRKWRASRSKGLTYDTDPSVFIEVVCYARMPHNNFMEKTYKQIQELKKKTKVKLPKPIHAIRVKKKKPVAPPIEIVEMCKKAFIEGAKSREHNFIMALRKDKIKLVEDHWNKSEVKNILDGVYDEGEV